MAKDHGLNLHDLADAFDFRPLREVVCADEEDGSPFAGGGTGGGVIITDLLNAGGTSGPMAEALEAHQELIQVLTKRLADFR